MTEKELIRCALMGDEKAQRECTNRGIMLSCPICGGEIKIKQCDWDKFYPYCDGCKFTFDFLFESKEDAIERVNIRPAPPIGRCGECKHYYSEAPGMGYCDNVQDVKCDTDYCSCFEPKEEK